MSVGSPCFGEEHVRGRLGQDNRDLILSLARLLTLGGHGQTGPLGRDFGPGPIDTSITLWVSGKGHAKRSVFDGQQC